MKKNGLEWFVFAASVLLILGMFGYLGVKALAYSDSPPDLRITVFSEPDKLQRNIYRLELMNVGEQTAENVLVEVTLVQGGKEVETGETSFPMAPQESKEKAWVTFRNPVQGGQQVKVHILGYNQP